MSLIISESQLEQVLDHARSGYPEEVCGILLGRRRDIQGHRQVEAVRPALNLNRTRAHDRYELDPGAYLEAEKEARERQWEIIGVYHTHPDHPPIPSETDRQRAAQLWGASESWSYMIIEVADGRVASWRSWVLREGRFDMEEAELIPVVADDQSPSK